MRRLNILELHRTIYEKKSRKDECYDNVLGICHRKIQMATKNNLTKLLFDVPEYVPGMPLYDITQCLKYMVLSLNNDGFFIRYYFPKFLYISWDFEEIEKKRKKESTNTPKTIQPVQQRAQWPLKPQTTIDLMPTSFINKKKTGKLELNLF
jgi:hypothetical protein